MGTVETLLLGSALTSTVFHARGYRHPLTAGVWASKASQVFMSFPRHWAIPRALYVAAQYTCVVFLSRSLNISIRRQLCQKLRGVSSHQLELS